MEQFDIEKLKRNTPYHLPKDTFGEMQENVLSQTFNKKQAPIFQLKWLYTAAAVIVLFIAFNFILNNNSSNPDSNLITNNTIALQNTAENSNYEISTSDINDTEISENILENDADRNLTSVPIAHLNNNQVKLKTQNKSTVRNLNLVPKPADEKVDDVLDGFTATDLALLTINTEQDVYLDLYN